MFAVIALILFVLAWFLHGADVAGMPAWFDATGLMLLGLAAVAAHLLWPLWRGPRRLLPGRGRMVARLLHWLGLDSASGPVYLALSGFVGDCWPCRRLSRHLRKHNCDGPVLAARAPQERQSRRLPPAPPRRGTHSRSHPRPAPARGIRGSRRTAVRQQARRPGPLTWRSGGE